MTTPEPTPIDWARLPEITAALPPGEVMERIRTGSKRGRMPGFREDRAEDGSPRFATAIFGLWWDRELIATVRPEGTGSRIGLARRDKRVIPAVIVAVLILSVWPGVILMDTFVPSSWGWIGTHVWWWYVPLTAISNVWAWVWAVRRTEIAMRASALEAIAAIVKEVDGSTVG